MADAEEVSSRSWRDMSTAGKARTVHEALNSQTRLFSVIRTLSSTTDGGDYAKDVLSTLRESVHGIDEFFSTFLASRFYNERHVMGSSFRPHRIFALSDLLEYMLSFLSVADLFTMRQVNGALRNTIDRSEVLQCEMHLSPSLDGCFKSPFEPGSDCVGLTGFTCEVIFPWNTAILGIEKVPGSYAVALEVQYDVSLSRAVVPNRSYPYRAMFVCQPPPMEMDVFPDCCSRHNYSSAYSIHGSDPLNAFLGLSRLRPAGKVVSATGITIGNLYDAIERIRAEHRLCPMAQEVTNHDEAGNNWPNISFGCLLKVRHDDPVVSPRIRAGCIARSPPPPPNWRILEYIDAKQQAYAAGRPIPTLAEFEAANRTNSGVTPGHNRMDSAYQSNVTMDPKTATDTEMTDDHENSAAS